METSKESGAGGETRTLTAINRWNLNPVRLPIPPLPHESAIQARSLFYLVLGGGMAAPGGIGLPFRFSLSLR